MFYCRQSTLIQVERVLNQQQRRTATGMSFTPVNVASIRKRHGISPTRAGMPQTPTVR